MAAEDRFQLLMSNMSAHSLLPENDETNGIDLDQSGSAVFAALCLLTCTVNLICSNRKTKLCMSYNIAGYGIIV